MSARLSALERLIDLRSIPFTEAEGRLMVRLAADGASLALTCAEYERPPDATGPVPRLWFPDASGAPLPIEAKARPHRLDLVVGGRSWVMAFVEPDAIMVEPPPGRSRLVLETTASADGLARATSGGPGLDAGPFRRVDGRGSFALACSTTRGRQGHGRDVLGRLVIDLGLETAPGDRIVLAHGRELDRVPALPQAARVLEASADRWEHRLARVPSAGAGRSGGSATSGVHEPSLRAAWVLAANTVRLRQRPEAPAVVPSKMGYAALWQWDAYFHAIGLRHLDPALARDQLRLAVGWQLPDGMLPDVVHDDGVLASSDDMEPEDRERSLLHVGRKQATPVRRLLVAPLTKPPLTALATWKVFEVDPDTGFLAELYPALARSQRWWWDRSRPHGRRLPIYLHPYSSGIDDSPLWDLGMPVETPDLPAYLALQADHLALIADALGRRGEADAWRRQAGLVADRLVERHWRAASGTFVGLYRGRRVPADTALGLLPIITGRLPRAVADRVTATLADPGRFWPRHPVPSVALSDPEFDPRTMWRGPTWLFIDWLLVDGLRRAGFADLAERLRERAMALVEQGEGMAEFYDPLDGSRPPRASAMFSGTAALYLDLLLAAPA